LHFPAFGKLSLELLSRNDIQTAREDIGAEKHRNHFGILKQCHGVGERVVPFLLRVPRLLGSGLSKDVSG
jgi:hypothetical protein